MKTREINNKHYIDAKVVMLYTDNKSDLQLNVIYNHLFSLKDGANISTQPYQHFYILSKEEIKEGDWFYFVDAEKYEHIFKRPDSEAEDSLWTRGKKIIATTDSSLLITLSEDRDIRGEQYERKFSLPQPSKEFIQTYIESYNNGKVIEDVLVAVEFTEPIITLNEDSEIVENYPFKLKLKDNAIIIKKKEEDWNQIIARIYDETPETELEIHGDRAVITQYLMDNYNPPTNK